MAWTSKDEKKLAGYPIHILTVQLAQLFQDHHYNPGFIQVVAIVNDCRD